MSGLLRRGTLAGTNVRLASRHLPRTRPTSFTSVYASQTCRKCRSYASKPPNKPKEKTPETSNSNDKKPGKPAAGFEDLFSKKTSLSPPSKDATQNTSQVPNPDLVKITKEEQETLDKLIADARQQLPAFLFKQIETGLEVIKKDGIPKELSDILKEIQKSGEITISHAMRFARIVRNPAMQEDIKESIEQVNKEKEQKKEQTSDGKKSNPGFGGFGGDGQKGTEVKFDASTLMASAVIAYLAYRSMAPTENSKEITWQEFRTNLLDRGLVEKLVVSDGRSVNVYVNKNNADAESGAQGVSSYTFTIGSVDSFESKLELAQDDLGIPPHERIPVQYTSPTNWGGILQTLLIFASPFLLMVFLSRRMGGGGGGANGIFRMGQSKAKKFNHETDIKIGFKDVAGMDEAKIEIMEFVSFLKEPEQFQRLGAKIPRGAILSGPPGTGKTLLAKATAGESKVPFFSVSGSEFVEMFVGVGASRVRDLFANARKSTPCIIFIDEIDAIGKARGKNNFGGNDEREATLNQILTEMDGFNTTEQVVVLAGTNRPDTLDAALMRPGRFDRHIAIDRPTMEGRKQIFAVHLEKIKTDLDMEHLKGRLAALTPGFSGADIANCCNEAALIAARGKATTVEMTHFEQAIERTVGGLEKKSLVLNPDEKKVVAYHEAGHAICGWYFKWADPLLKVSIIPRGQGALGYAQYLPDGDTYLMNVNQLMDRMAMTLGGRVSEEIHFETVTSGASDDFKKVTRMASAMVSKWGMSKKIGYLYFEEDPNQIQKPFSEETARNIDNEVRRIVDEAYQQCKDLLTEKKKEVGLVAEELLKKEVLGREDMIRLLGKRPFESKGEFEKYFGGEGPKSAPPPPPTEGVMPSPSPAFKDL